MGSCIIAEMAWDAAGERIKDFEELHFFFLRGHKSPCCAIVRFFYCAILLALGVVFLSIVRFHWL